MNLVEEVGPSYMAERFAGCVFLNADNQPCFINPDKRAMHWGTDTVKVTAVTGPVSKRTVVACDVPLDFFTDLSVFKVPPLGWRATNNGRYLAFFSRNNESYNRAVSVNNIVRTLAQPTRYLINSGAISADTYNSDSATALLLLKPEYTPLREGLEQIRNGLSLSFAVNPNIAVIPAADNKQAIYFNLNRVAMVDPDGSITCDNPIITELLKGLET